MEQKEKKNTFLHTNIQCARLLLSIIGISCIALPLCMFCYLSQKSRAHVTRDSNSTIHKGLFYMFFFSYISQHIKTVRVCFKSIKCAMKNFVFCDWIRLSVSWTVMMMIHLQHECVCSIIYAINFSSVANEYTRICLNCPRLSLYLSAWNQIRFFKSITKDSA